jgi:adenylate cyclase class IV
MAREVEIKVELQSDEQAQELHDLALSVGFIEGDNRTELDFVPDTSDYACREAGLLLRVRQVQRPETPPRMLITLKIKNQAMHDIQDSEELQFYIGDSDAKPIFAKINAVLEQGAHFALPPTLLKVADFPAAYHLLVEDLELTSRRAFVEKRRRTLHRGTSELSLDIFPEPIGSFLELETRTPDQLRTLVDELKLTDAPLDARYYGDIVDAKQAKQPESERRTALFPETHASLGSMVMRPA